MGSNRNKNQTEGSINEQTTLVLSYSKADGAGQKLGQTVHFGLEFKWPNGLQIGNFFLVWINQLPKFSKQQVICNFNKKSNLGTDLKFGQNHNMQLLTLQIFFGHS